MALLPISTSELAPATSYREEHHDIDPSGDLVIKIVEYKHFCRGIGGTVVINDDVHDAEIYKIAYMRVRRDVLRENSLPLECLLDPIGPWKEAGEEFVTLRDDTVVSMRIWFHLLHGKADSEMGNADIRIAEVWHAIEASRKYFFDIRKLCDWFGAWWKRHEGVYHFVDDMRQLLYPCYTLNCAHGFKAATVVLAFRNSGKIKEFNPTRHRHLYLPPAVIQKLNDVRFLLIVKLNEALFNPITLFLEGNCKCKEKALFEYCKGLRGTEIWPLDKSKQDMSIEETLSRLGNLSYKSPNERCSTCKRISALQEMPKDITVDFDGLCLDCMKTSEDVDPVTNNFKGPPWEGSYWDQDLFEKWGKYCRLNHGQPSWYFSFMGSSRDMIEWKRRQKNKRLLKVKRESDRRRLISEAMAREKALKNNLDHFYSIFPRA